MSRSVHTPTPPATSRCAGTRGADHTKSGGDTLIDNAGHASVVGLNVNVDANTYGCGRIWDKDGSSYALYHGQNWQCIKTHP